MAKTNQQLVVQVRERLSGIRYCPQTGGQQLRCTKSGFDRTCAALMNKARHKSGTSYRSYDACLACNQYPPEALFLSIGEILGKTVEKEKPLKSLSKKERPMTKESGSCELCMGSGKALKKYAAMRVCASCQMVMIAAKNRPEAVMAALAKFDNLPMAAELCQTDDSVDLDAVPDSTADKGGSIEERMARLEGYVGRIEAVGEIVALLCARNGCTAGSARHGSEV